MIIIVIVTGIGLIDYLMFVLNCTTSLCTDVHLILSRVFSKCASRWVFSRVFSRVFLSVHNVHFISSRVFGVSIALMCISFQGYFCCFFFFLFFLFFVL